MNVILTMMTVIAVFPHFFKKIGFLNFISIAGYFYPHRGIPNNGLSEENINQTVSFLNKIKFLAAFHLGPVKKSDVFISALLETLKDKKWKVISSTTGYDFGRDVPENYDDYLATISKIEKKQLNRRKRNLEKLGQYNI